MHAHNMRETRRWIKELSDKFEILEEYGLIEKGERNFAVFADIWTSLLERIGEK